MPTKNILLLYITEVSGHHSASLAIEKSLKLLNPGINVRNINAFRFTNPISEKIVNRIYTTIIKHTPKVWDYVYDNPSVKKNLERMKKVIHTWNSPKLKKLFDEFKPDVVVCTQAYPCGMVADFKKTHGSKVPLVGVLTDYVPHSYWLYDTVDYYITPSEEVSQRLAKKGVPAQKIKPLGIPFNPHFNDPVDPAEVRRKLGFTPGMRTILIMGGGQGLGPVKTIVQSLEKVPYELQEIIVTGTNKKLFRSLKRKIKHAKKKIVLLGYAHNVNELMSVSDLIITKPGGITTSEALSKKLPMLIIKPIPGQEENNTVFLTQQRAALKVDRPAQIDSAVKDLFAHPEKLKELANSCARIAKSASGMDIARFITEI